MAAEAPSKRDHSSAPPSCTGGHEHVVDGGFLAGLGGGHADAGHGRHVGDTLGHLVEVDLEIGRLPDLHKPGEPALVIDGAGHADRLMGRAEMRIAAHFQRDLAAEPAEAGQVRPFRGLGQLPPDMQLGRALGRGAAALDNQRRSPEVVDEMIALGRDVARVEIDHEALHLQDVGRAGLARLRHRAGDDIDRGTLARGPAREGAELLGRGGVRVDPDVVRPAVLALTLVDEAADRDQAFAVAEDHVDEAPDLARVRFDREGIGQGCCVVEIPPRVEVDDVVGARRKPPAALGPWAEPAFEEVAIGGDARQQIARIGRPQDPHAAVGHALREFRVERHELVVQLRRVLVDRSEERGGGRDARHRRFHVGLVERDLRGVDGLGDGHAPGHGLAPVLRVHRLALPERGGAQPQRRGGLGDDPIDMAADAAARDGEAELAAVPLLGDPIEPRRA
jgi:hypothetical protein